MPIKLQQRHGTAASWTSANPILKLGEAGWESDTGQGKIGDGVSHWNNLPYVGTGGGGGSGLTDLDGGDADSVYGGVPGIDAGDA